MRGGAWTLLETFKENETIRALDGFRILQRLFSEQCDVEAGGNVVATFDKATCLACDLRGVRGAKRHKRTMF